MENLSKNEKMKIRDRRKLICEVRRKKFISYEENNMRSSFKKFYQGSKYRPSGIRFTGKKKMKLREKR